MTRNLLATLFFITLVFLSAAPVVAGKETPTIVVGHTYPHVVAPFCTTAKDVRDLAYAFRDGGVQAGFSHLKGMASCFYFGSELPFTNIRVIRLVEKDISVKDQPEKLAIVEIEPADDVTHEYSLFVLTFLPVLDGQSN